MQLNCQPKIKLRDILFILFMIFLISLTVIAKSQNRLDLPNDTIDCIHKTYYSFKYSEEHEIAIWSSYMLTPAMINCNSVNRVGRFIPNPEISTFTANNSDYYKSGYDRGHLVPAADMLFSEVALYETFYYSNCSPQTAQLNRGVWRILELKIRKLAENDTLYIITGPILLGEFKKIGDNQVSVPELYYKAVKCDNEYIAFLLPNLSYITDKNLSHYAVSVDFLEALLNIDLFTKCDNNDFYESYYDLTFWRF